MTQNELYALIAKAEQWQDEVQPYREEMNDSAKAWRQGFNAAMQRIEVIWQQMNEA